MLSPNLRTYQQWLTAGRSLRYGEKPTHYLAITGTNDAQPLYHLSQTYHVDDASEVVTYEDMWARRKPQPTKAPANEPRNPNLPDI